MPQDGNYPIVQEIPFLVAFHTAFDPEGSAMVRRRRKGALTPSEKRYVKALIGQGWRNQDIVALINIGRDATINSARVTEVKQNDNIRPRSEEDTSRFIRRKKAYDYSTGLNRYEDERLVRAREAMKMAVTAFNSPTTLLKSEIFAVLANIGWTYLLHQYYLQQNVEIEGDDGNTLLLSQMIKRQDFPLSSGIARNLIALIKIRNDVEHKLLEDGDVLLLPKFQACCLNFDQAICKLFGEDKSLGKEMSLGLLFSKPNLDQLATVSGYDIPSNISALNASLDEGLTEDEQNDVEYQFKVIYTLTAASKSGSHIQFIRPDSEDGQQIQNMLIKHNLADDLYPHKPMNVMRIVAESTGLRFTSRNHTQAWKLFNCRPPANANDPKSTDKRYCIFHASHGDYTYNQDWIDFLIDKVNQPEEFQRIRNQNI